MENMTVYHCDSGTTPGAGVASTEAEGTMSSDEKVFKMEEQTGEELAYVLQARRVGEDKAANTPKCGCCVV